MVCRTIEKVKKIVLIAYMEVAKSIAIKTSAIADQDLEELEVTKLVLSTCVDLSEAKEF